MIVFSELGDTAVVIPVAIVVFLWFVWKRSWRTAAYWAGAVGFAAAINTAIKVAVHRARPNEGLYSGWSDFSFPSGHSTTNAVLYGFLAFLVVRQIRPRLQLPVITTATANISLIAFSRIYLGAHWFSDVAGGLAFAVAWLALLSIAYQNHQTRERASGGLLLLVLGTVILAGGLNIYRNHGADMERYAVQYKEQNMPAADWWKSEWATLPEHRVDFDGETREPITFQWAGSLADLQETLQLTDWRVAAPWSWAGALAWLTPAPDPMTSPILPTLERGRLPSLTLVHPTRRANGRIVLRIWATDIDLQNGHLTELWIGSVVEEDLINRLSLITLPQVRPNFNASRDLLAGSIQASKLPVRVSEQIPLIWDGGVLLAHDSQALWSDGQRN
jgi:undecaprenyl-diphosphatase